MSLNFMSYAARQQEQNKMDVQLTYTTQNLTASGKKLINDDQLRWCVLQTLEPDKKKSRKIGFMTFSQD